MVSLLFVILVIFIFITYVILYHIMIVITIISGVAYGNQRYTFFSRVTNPVREDYSSKIRGSASWRQFNPTKKPGGTNRYRWAVLLHTLSGREHI